MTRSRGLRLVTAFSMLTAAAVLAFAQSAAKLPADLDPDSRARLPYLQRKDMDEQAERFSTRCRVAARKASCEDLLPSRRITGGSRKRCLRGTTRPSMKERWTRTRASWRSNVPSRRLAPRSAGRRCDWRGGEGGASLVVSPVERPAVAMPRETPARRVGHRAPGIGGESHADSQKRVLDAAFGPLDDISIERIFGHDEPEGADGRDHIINPARCFWSHPDVADRGLAQRPDFKLKAVAGAECKGAHPRGPVGGRRAEIRGRCGVVVQPDVPRCRAMNGMPDVIDQVSICVAPLPGNADRPSIVRPEFTVLQRLACFFLQSDARAVLDQKQLQRVGERAENIGPLLFLSRCRKRILRGRLIGHTRTADEQGKQAQSSTPLRHRSTSLILSSAGTLRPQGI
jgi:hypothetical protein